jgi:hypothetical protein
MKRSTSPILPCSTGCWQKGLVDRDAAQPVHGAHRPNTVHTDAHPMGIYMPHAMPHALPLDPSPHLEKTR